MPHPNVDAAYQARLAASWTICPVVGANGVTLAPEGVDAFLVVQYPLANGEKPVLGRTYFEDGVARLVLNVKSGIGLTTGLAWAETLASLFRDREFSNIRTFTPDPPIVNDANDDGQWFEFVVLSPYRYQFNDA